MPISNLCLTFKLSVAQPLLQKDIGEAQSGGKEAQGPKRGSKMRSFVFFKTCNVGIRMRKILFKHTWIEKKRKWRG